MSEDCVFEKYYREIRAKDGAIERIETRVPAHFNFAYDVVDWFAERTPDKPALLHKSIDGVLTEFTFGDMKRRSDEAAIALSEVGVGRGDAVMLLLKRRYEFWIAMLALHKLGAIAVPTSHMVSGPCKGNPVRELGAHLREGGDCRARQLRDPDRSR